MNNFDEQLQKIRELKKEATVMRNLEEYDEAFTLCDKAIEAGNNLLAMVTSDKALAQIVRTEIADAFGMRGGIYRRLRQSDKALQEYTKGYEIEKKDRLSTYNLSNLITLKILEGQATTDESQIQDLIRDAIDRLKEETNEINGPRKDEFWAWADLGQFYLLADNLPQAEIAYQNALKTGPSREGINRHRTILQGLSDKIKETNSAVGDKFERIINNLSPYA